jgi:hypothetical protein
LTGLTASAPIACTGILSETGRNVAPLSTDFQTPPDAGAEVPDARVAWNAGNRRDSPALAGPII